MNSDTVQGQWNQIRGNIKTTFGKLTDDDLLQADGNADKLQGALQERYGYTKEKAQREWESFTHRYASLTDEAKQSIDTVVDGAKQKIGDMLSSGAQTVKHAADQVEKAVKN